MGRSLQPMDMTGPGGICLLETPFEAYTDSPCSMAVADADSINERVVKSSATVRVEAIPLAEVGPRIGKWRYSLAGFIQSWFTTCRADRDDDLPLLSGNTPKHQKWSRKSCVERWLVRGLLGFFVML